MIYGGRSSEHEVSLASAASIFSQLDRTRYEPIPLFIAKTGRWYIPDRLPTTESVGAVIQQAREATAFIPDAASEAYLVPHPAGDTVVTIARDTSVIGQSVDRAVVRGLSLDVVFPIVHGPYGEDGTLQGLLELANVPYVGAGVLSSALAMDKVMAKIHFAARGLPLVDHTVVPGSEWDHDPNAVITRVEQQLGYPIFVKPANLGSSIGVSRATDNDTLRSALATAWKFDNKLLVEAAVTHPREIECSVLGNNRPEASVPGEVIPSGAFYDYNAKYVDAQTQLVIPADLTPERITEVQTIAVAAYQSLDCAGMARVDFLLDGSSDQLYVNEVNTLPGFTTISQYAKLWEASGLPYPALLDRLIDLALAQYRRRQRVQTSSPQ